MNITRLYRALNARHPRLELSMAAVLEVADCPNGITMTGVQKAVMCSQANVGCIVVRLVEHGLIFRFLDSGDRRRRMIRITEKGEKYLERLREGQEQ